jgi:hypothetical protein
MKKWIALMLFALALAALTGCGAEKEAEIVEFGRYEQDGNAENGPEPIEWIVLRKEKDRTLLLSRYVIESMPYNELHAGDGISLMFWPDCTLRTWLNGEFMDMAFTPQARARIAETENKNIVENDFFYGEDPDTTDRVFLLSKEELESYYRDRRERRAVPTAYAAQNGVRVDNKGFCKWWTRSFSEEDHAYYVDAGGRLGKRGFYIYYYEESEIRPAIWIKSE